MSSKGLWRSEFSHKPKRIVIKVGSQCLTSAKEGVKTPFLKSLVEDISYLVKRGTEVVLVSSGAINLGKNLIKESSSKKNHISYDQACAAVGQPVLISQYSKFFQKRGHFVGQVLLTHNDLKNKERHFNLKTSIEKLLKQKIIPILNENDCVSFEEITLGDNDQLAAMSAQMLQADCLLFLTEVDGVYTKDPAKADAIPIAFVPQSESLSQILTLTKTKAGKGGMETKVMAAKRCRDLGINVIIASNEKKKPILRALKEPKGTFFQSRPFEKMKKGRILTTTKKDSYLVVDRGAFDVLTKNSSLLPVGIKEVKGQFVRGDSVALVFEGKVFASGISEYSASECREVMGKKSKDIPELLKFTKVAIHRDNLIVKKDGK
jgi:glutamate 5-kinase